MISTECLHIAILSSVLGGKLSATQEIVKPFYTQSEALLGFQTACNTLIALQFEECKALRLPNRQIIRFFEKDGWNFLVCLSVENNLLIITLTNKEKLINELSSTY